MNEVAMRAEYAKAKQELADAEGVYNKKRNIFSAMHQLMRAHDYSTEVAVSHDEPQSSEDDEDNKDDSLGTTELVRRALPPIGQFTVEQVMEKGGFVNGAKGTISLVLWKLAKKGEIKTVMPGSRMRPATYARL